MGVKKRPYSGGNGPRFKSKRQDSYDQSSLIATYRFFSRKKAETNTVIRRSAAFLLITNVEYSNLKSSKAFAEMRSDTLEFIQPDDGVNYLCIQNFTALDLALVLGFVFANRAKQWIGVGKEDPVYIPRQVPIRGSFYVHKSSQPAMGTRGPTNGVTVAQFTELWNFTEISVDRYGLPLLFDAICELLGNLSFKKSADRTKQEFPTRLRDLTLKRTIAVTSIPFLDRDILMDPATVSKINGPIIEESKKSLKSFVETVLKYNEAAPVKTTEATESAKAPSNTSRSSRKITPSTSRYSGSSNADQVSSRSVPARPVGANGSGRTLDPQSRGSNANYLSQEQIRDYCIATVKASIDAVKSKSPYQILKTYIKCPRQHYVDLIYDNLHDLRSKTNCNAVVMNLNNVHESTAWFNSLNVSKHTKDSKIVSVPHPSTVRVVSIGGIGEHNLEALKLLLELLETQV
ncbi:LAFA_0F18448g1_1 [Lachancea sp. 'fantastica']|nr:LAFA_0F18448g1_1 [Lachancea sp. 'fantastica']